MSYKVFTAPRGGVLGHKVLILPRRSCKPQLEKYICLREMFLNGYSEPLDVQSIKNELENVSGDAITILMKSGKAENSCHELPKQSPDEPPILRGQHCCYTIADEISKNFDIVGIIETQGIAQDLITDNMKKSCIILGRRRNDDI